MSKKSPDIVKYLFGKQNTSIENDCSSTLTPLCYSLRLLKVTPQVLKITFSHFTVKKTKTLEEVRCLKEQYLMSIYCVPRSFMYTKGILMGESSLFLIYIFRTENHNLPPKSQLLSCLAKTHEWETQGLTQYRYLSIFF